MVCIRPKQVAGRQRGIQPSGKAAGLRQVRHPATWATDTVEKQGSTGPLTFVTVRETYTQAVGSASSTRMTSSATPAGPASPGKRARSRTSRNRRPASPR